MSERTLVFLGIGAAVILIAIFLVLTLNTPR